MIWKSSPRRCVYRDYIAIYLVSDQFGMTVTATSAQSRRTGQTKLKKPYIPQDSTDTPSQPIKQVITPSIGRLRTIPYFRYFQFIRVSSLVGRYFYNMYNIIAKKFEIVFPLVSKTIVYFHVYIILDFPITYRNDSVLVNQNTHVYKSTSQLSLFKIIK